MPRRLPSTSLVSRRSFLARGLFGGAGLAALPRLLLAQPPVGEGAPAQALIHVFLQGGMSHLDTFDPKPLAPVEYRGEFRAIPTKIPGEVFSEVLPQLARVADRLAVIRSLTHTEAAHERGTHSMLTGFQPSPAVTYPSLGSVVSHELGSRHSLPPYVTIPNAQEIFLGTGYLSAAHAPFSPGGDPANQRFQVRDLAAPQGLDAKRQAARRELLRALDAGFGAQADAVAATARFYEQAFALSDSQAARAAFELAAEKDPLRDRYGRGGIGQRLLLARRLVEAGVRCVTVLDGGWDHHQRIFNGLRDRVRPLDQGLAALVLDLEERGLLATTLVLVTTEFGRTPRVNPDGGRDHWPRVFSAVLCGGGVKRGCVYGASNDVGAEVDSDPVSPADLTATLFAQLGIDPTKKLMSPGNRPIDLVRDGRVLREILA